MLGVGGTYAVMNKRGREGEKVTTHPTSIPTLISINDHNRNDDHPQPKLDHSSHSPRFSVHNPRLSI